MADESFVQAIESFRAFQASPESTAVDVCGIYRKARPILKGVLPFLKLLPVYGETVAEALTALMGVLDGICPGT